MRRYTIEQTGEHEWQLVAIDGDEHTVIGTFTDAAARNGYEQAVDVLSGLIERSLRADAGDGEGNGLLPEMWVSDKGIAFSERLAGGRDFTNTKWMWRDPASATVPLMLMTKTDVGHFGAELAGIVTEISNADGTISAAGRFYDTEVGQQARSYLADGQSFGVSVDPGESTDVEEEFTCTEFDEEGFCQDGEYSLNFLTYEIIGLTMTAMQGFPNAAIKLAGTVQASAHDGYGNAGNLVVVETGEAIVAAADGNDEIDVPVKPPAAAMLLAEPRLGEPFLGSMGDEFLVDHGDGTLGVPLTIDPPFVFGHIARWGACHTADPLGDGCTLAPRSDSGYAYFHTGHVLCEDGTDVPTGVLTVGPEHAPERATAWAAKDYYASVANGWADVHVVDGEYGAWCAGVLRPGLTEMDLRVLRALALSGDWRGIGGKWEMIGVLAVNAPGFPIKREALRASAFGEEIASPALRSRTHNGEPQVLIAAGMVARCPECQKRRAEAGAERTARLAADPRIDKLLAVVETLERRTRHFEADAVRSFREQIGAL